MIGFNLFNLKIIHNNQENLLSNDAIIDDNIKRFKNNFNKDDNITIFRFINKTAFLICTTVNKKTFLFRYEDGLIFDSIKYDDFVNIFKENAFVKNIIKLSFTPVTIKPLTPKMYNIINNYIKHYEEKTIYTTQYYENKTEEDFEIKDDGIEL